MVSLIILREILFFVMVLVGLFGVIAAVVLMFVDRAKIGKEFDKAMLKAPTAENIANGLLEKLGENDKPIMLNVSQDRLIEKVADEMERRQELRKG